jgi:hypothetical protein
MPCVGFESMIPAFERAKTVHALDRATAVIDLTEMIRATANRNVCIVIVRRLSCSQSWCECSPYFLSSIFSLSNWLQFRCEVKITKD